MTDRLTTLLVSAAAGMSLLAAGGAEANRLLNEGWLKTATGTQVTEEIASGADVNAVHPKWPLTPLMLASRHSNLGAMEALLEAGVDPNRIADPDYGSPMHWAADGHAVAMLFDYGAVIDARNSNGQTPLHLAAWDSRTNVMRALIRRGADVNAHTSEPMLTPLYLAARDAQPAAVQILLEAGAEIDLPSMHGLTPLYAAAKLNTPQMVELLLDAGADPTIQTDNRWFPAETAMRNNPRVSNHPVINRLFEPLAGITALPGEASDAPCDGWRVRPGDTGHIIAEEGLGDRSRFREIGRLNGLSGRNMHAVGMCLKLPERRAGAGSASQPAQACSGYVVRSSDRKLGDVAEAALGDRNRWPEIARLNGITSENPHRPGQCLELPG